MFKEGIDTESRNKIFKFISEETKHSGQVIFYVAEFKGDETYSASLFDVETIKKTYFSSDIKLICIGDSKTKRSFLSDLALMDNPLIRDSIRLLEVVIKIFIRLQSRRYIKAALSVEVLNESQAQG